VTDSAPDVEPLLAIAVGTLDITGRLLQGNAGFLRLFTAEGSSPYGAHVDQFFVQPDFSSIIGGQADACGEIYRGLLTMVDRIGRTRTLRARVRRVDAGVHVLAEYNIEELERVYDTMFEINQSYANAQLEVVQTNLKLQQREKQLEEAVARVTAAHRDLERAQKQMLQSEKLASVGNLAAGVAHEINNPIAFVNSNMGLLKCYVDDLLSVIDAYESADVSDGNLSNAFAAARAVKTAIDLPYLKEDVASIFAESLAGLDRVKRIVRALRDFSQIDSLETWKEADILEGLESTLSVMSGEFKGKCQVRKEYGELPQVQCVISQLNQVFMNVLLNAAHATKDEGVVTIRTGHTGSDVWVDIADTGEGIRPEDLPRIFDPFFTTRPFGSGTGLGLSVSYGIVEKHHGRIEVKSEVGKGSTFRIWLPIRQPTAMP
jgi:two-component system, NtrC family, sensor kinase